MMIRSRYPIVLALATVSAVFAQTGTGALQGTAKDDTGKPIAGAYAVATGIGTVNRQSHTALISASGQFSFTGLEPGQYQVCIQEPGGQHLDPCKWAQPAPITVASGKTASPAVTATTGASLQVRINDPLKLLAQGKGPADLIIGVRLPTAIFVPMRLASSDATGRTYDVAIPTGARVRLLVNSAHLQLADSNNLSLAAVHALPGSPAAGLASSSTLGEQVPVGNATQLMTFTVTGKK
jgi:hypothetical protein